MIVTYLNKAEISRSRASQKIALGEKRDIVLSGPKTEVTQYVKNNHLLYPQCPDKMLKTKNKKHKSTLGFFIPM